MYHITIETSKQAQIDSISKKVRKLRCEHLWTQAELAEQVGIGRATVARIETGKCVPRMTTIRNLAEVFGVSTQELVTDPEVLWGHT
ncbi:MULTISPECIES: helix-turn-helix transcriptional regulator [Ferrimicrobium]|uniref:Helix-turn-helix transcriptional regulator n=1 Tax=Ferrimicrobium acidiphilum TaxID=121039 RepID=A0ABV3Y3H8_9ACTN